MIRQAIEAARRYITEVARDERCQRESHEVRDLVHQARCAGLDRRAFLQVAAMATGGALATKLAGDLWGVESKLWVPESGMLTTEVMMVPISYSRLAELCAIQLEQYQDLIPTLIEDHRMLDRLMSEAKPFKVGMSKPFRMRFPG